jgi:hypothetical protein
MNSVNNPADGKFVVIQDGQRVTTPTANQEEADAEAKKRNQVAESSGQPLPENRRAEVKRNLFG